MASSEDDEFCFVRGEEEEDDGVDDVGAPSPFTPALQAETEDNASINRFLELNVLPEEPQPATGTTPAPTATVPKQEAHQKGKTPPHQPQPSSSDASSFNAWHSNPHYHTSPPASPRHTTTPTPVYTSGDEASSHAPQPRASNPPPFSERKADGQPGSAPEGAASMKFECPGTGAANSSRTDLHGTRSHGAVTHPANTTTPEHHTHAAHSPTDSTPPQPPTATSHIATPGEVTHSDQPPNGSTTGTHTARIRITTPAQTSARLSASTRSGRSSSRKEHAPEQPCMPRLFACLLLCMCCGRMLEHTFAWLLGARASLLPSLQGADWPSVAVEISQWFMTATVFFSALVSLNVMDVKRSRAARRLRARGLRVDWLAVCTMVLALTAHFCVVTLLYPPKPGGIPHPRQHHSTHTAHGSPTRSDDPRTCNSGADGGAHAANAAAAQAAVQATEQLRHQLAQRELELAQKAKVIERLLDAQQKQQHAAKAEQQASAAASEVARSQQQQQQQQKDVKVHHQSRWPWSSFGSHSTDAATASPSTHNTAHTSTGPSVNTGAHSAGDEQRKATDTAQRKPSSKDAKKSDSTPPPPASAHAPPQPPDSPSSCPPGHTHRTGAPCPASVSDSGSLTAAMGAAARATRTGSSQAGTELSTEAQSGVGQNGGGGGGGGAAGGGAIVPHKPGLGSSWVRALRRVINPSSAALAVRQHSSSLSSAMAHAARSTAHGIQARGAVAHDAAARVHAAVRAAAHKGGVAVWQHSADALSHVRAVQRRASRAVHAGTVACGGWMHDRGMAFGHHMHTRSVALYHRVSNWVEKILLTARYIAKVVHKPRDTAADVRKWLKTQREHVLPRLHSARDAVKGVCQRGAASMRLRWRSSLQPQEETQQVHQQQGQQKGQQKEQAQEGMQHENKGDGARVGSRSGSTHSHSRLFRMRNLIPL